MIKRILLLLSLLLLVQAMPIHAFSFFGYEIDLTPIATAYASARSYLFGQSVVQPTVNQRLPVVLPEANPTRSPSTAAAQRRVLTLVAAPEAAQTAEASKIATAATVAQSELSTSPTNVALRRVATLTGHIAPPSKQLVEFSKIIAAPTSAKTLTTTAVHIQQPQRKDDTKALYDSIDFATLTQDKIKQLLAGPYSRDVLIQKVIDNFGELASSDEGCVALQSIMDYYPVAAEKFVEPAVNNFKQVIDSGYGHNVIASIMDHYPAAAERFIELAVNNFKQLAKYSGAEVLRSIMNHYPAVAERFIELAVDNFKQLADSPADSAGYEAFFLKFIMNKYPAVAERFVELAVDNFMKLADSYEGVLFLKFIMNKYPLVAEKFVDPAVDNFKELVDSIYGQGPLVLEFIIDHYPLAAEKFVEPAVANFKQLIDSIYGWSVLRSIMKHYPASAEKFVEPVVNNFKQLASLLSGQVVFKSIIEHYPASAEKFFEFAVDNFKQLADLPSGQGILEFIMDHYPSSAEKFFELAVNNFKQLANSLSGQVVLKSIIEHYPLSAEKFVEPVVNNFKQLINSKEGWKTLRSIIEHYPAAVGIFLQAFMQQNENLFYPFNDLQQEPKTQTKQHLFANLFEKYSALKSGGDIDYECCPELQDMTRRVIDFEWQEQQKGRYTFVHAHQWQYHFFQEMYTNLWEVVNGPLGGNYRKIRYTNPLQESWESFMAYIQEQEKMREKLLDKSVTQYYTADATCQWHMLFMNYALFTNKFGSNTANYIKVNRSENPVTIKALDFIKELKLDQYFNESELTKIADTFDQLQREHDALSKYGGGLLFSFTPETLKKAVYPVYGGGAKRTVEIEGIGKTDDVKLILDTLRTSPEKIKDSDQIEFVCVLSHDCTLIPNNGLDIYEFNAADQEKLVAWRIKKDAFIKRIQQRVDERRAAEQKSAPQKMSARL